MDHNVRPMVKNDINATENDENMSPPGNEVGVGDENISRKTGRTGTRFKRRLPEQPAAGPDTDKNMQPEGEKLEEQHAPRRRPDARRQDIKTADEAASYDLTRDAALNLERMAGPNSCLPCATWNHLCGMGFRMSGYVPVYEKARVNINLEVANKHWLAVTIGGLSQIGGRLSRTVCPYVRLHVLSLHSGDYILSVPLVPAGEADNLSKEGRPLAALNTAPCRLGALDADVHWDETFLIDAQFTAVTSPNSLLLFEVLDNPPSIKKSNDAGAGKKGKFSACLAWAYLIPRGTRSGRLNFAVPTDRGDPRREGRDGGEGSNADDVAVDEKSALLSQKAEDNEASAFLPARLQLYEYREESWLVEGLQRRNMTWQPRPSQGLLKTPTNPVAHAASTALVGHRVVPEVYLQWRRQRHVKAAGVLSVMMSYQRRSLGSLMHVVSQDAGVAPDSMTRPIDGDEKRSLAKDEAERTAMRGAVARRSRAPGEPTTLPNRILHRCQTGGIDGSVVCAYSSCGVLLAIGSLSSRNSVSHPAPRGGGGSRLPGALYCVSILDADTGAKLWSDGLAHFGVIYDIKWSSNNETLVSCSADGRIRVYTVKLLSRGFRDHKEGLLENILDRRQESMRVVAPRAGAVSVGSIHATVSVTVGRALETSPPVFIYCLALQESFGAAGAGGVRILSGGSDGRIKVWDATSSDQCGELLSYDPSKEATNLPIFSPHDRPIQAAVIDSKSRYLYTGDAGGTILMWRQDARGWYQIMRRLKKDDTAGLSIQSLAIYTTPVPAGHASSTKAYAQTRSYMLIMACPPSSPSEGTAAKALLQLYDLATYKPVSTYSGFNPPSAAFTRASICRDGRYVATCCTVSSDTAAGTSLGESSSTYIIKCWDAFAGHLVRSRLSELPWIYPVRCVDWAPRQNVLAACSTGTGATTCILSAEKISAKLAAAVLTEAVSSPLHAVVEEDVLTDSRPQPNPGVPSMVATAPARSGERNAPQEQRGRTMGPLTPLRRSTSSMSPKGARSPSPQIRGQSPGMVRSPNASGMASPKADTNAEKTRKLKDYLDQKKAAKRSNS